MEDTLKRLLDAELRAQALVDQAFHQRDHMLEQAREETRIAEERFKARIPEVQSAFVSKAEKRADQTISELERRHDERRSELEAMAEGRREDAAEAAIAYILDSSHL
jgi:vacuolar-type H+-ATPase subunit H